MIHDKVNSLDDDLNLNPIKKLIKKDTYSFPNAYSQ